jgi:Protein of unknown function (DUF559)
VIELDGDSHAETVEYDPWRTEKMKERRYRVLRFFNDEVQKSRRSNRGGLASRAGTPLPNPPPCQKTGEGIRGKAAY